MNRGPLPLEVLAARAESSRSDAAARDAGCHQERENNAAATARFAGPAPASSPLMLTPAELVALSGYRRPRDQVAWITEHYGIRAYVNAANEAVVIRAHLEAALQPPANARRVRTVREVSP
jgi:hypothetical protein